MSFTRKVFRRAPKVFTEADGTVAPFPHQFSRVLRVKPLDVIFRRLVKRALVSKQTRHGQ